jgi:hypothetical protein
MIDNEIVVRQGNFIAPVADIHTALLRYQAVKDFIGSVLKLGTDYGKIPGNDKLVLLKPGAEKMCAFFGFSVRFILSDYVEDWTGKDHGGEPFFNYRYRAQLWRGDQLIAEGEGSCNSWEKKYRYRQAERVCPKCGKATIIKGKEEYGGGWLCYVKKGGCGAKFVEDATDIVNQQVGQMKNSDPADIVNTLQKMSQKRALVAPVLIATNTSDYFTQDIDDFIDGTFVDTAPSQSSLDAIRQSEQHSQELKAQVVKPSHGDMTLDEAMAELSHEGTPYGELSNDELSKRSIGIDKALKKNNMTSDKQDEYVRKMEAIKLILASRAASPIQAGAE